VRKLCKAIALTLITFIMTISCSTQLGASIDGIVVFGDSLSDVGQVFRFSSGLYPPNPPYFEGRYSNGQVWVEYLAQQLSLSMDQMQNFAWGGATTEGSGESQVPSLLEQVESATLTEQSLSGNALYILWAGANDYLQGQGDVTAPVENVMEAIAALTNRGAHVFLVANLPDLGRLPATRGNGSAAGLSALTQAHNQRLQQRIDQFNAQQPDRQILLLDVFALYDAALATPNQFGFTDVTGTCLTGTQPCANPDQFLFWDGIHPSTAGHQILAEAAYTALQQAGLLAPYSPR